MFCVQDPSVPVFICLFALLSRCGNCNFVLRFSLYLMANNYTLFFFTRSLDCNNAWLIRRSIKDTPPWRAHQSNAYPIKSHLCDTPTVPLKSPFADGRKCPASIKDNEPFRLECYCNWYLSWIINQTDCKRNYELILNKAKVSRRIQGHAKMH